MKPNGSGGVPNLNSTHRSRTGKWFGYLSIVAATARIVGALSSHGIQHSHSSTNQSRSTSRKTQPMKTSKARRHIIGILISILIFVFSTEFLLSTFDPLGINRYEEDLHRYFNHVVDGNGLVVLPDGELHFANWKATIEDGARVTATQPGNCHIAFMGDSVTFGLGVNDSDVWVNLLARSYAKQTHPDVEIHNYAYPGYNAGNLSAAFQRIEADGYVYFVIENDSEPPLQPRAPRPAPHLWTLQRYVLFLALMYRHANYQPLVTDEFKSFLEQLPENTLVIGFKGEVLAGYAAEHHGAILVEPYTERVSMADGHANAAGNRQIYAAVQPYVEAFIRRICG